MGAESGFLALFFVCFSCFLVAVFFGVRALMLLYLLLFCVSGADAVI